MQTSITDCKFSCGFLSTYSLYFLSLLSGMASATAGAFAFTERFKLEIIARCDP